MNARIENRAFQKRNETSDFPNFVKQYSAPTECGPGEKSCKYVEERSSQTEELHAVKDPPRRHPIDLGSRQASTSEMSKPQTLTLFVAGNLAGVTCGGLSHPLSVTKYAYWNETVLGFRDAIRRLYVHGGEEPSDVNSSARYYA